MKPKPIRRILIAGLLVWLPLTATFVVVRFMVDLLDKTLALIPKAYQPDILLGFHIPGLGLLLALAIVLLTGIVATNFFGRHLVHLWEKMVARIPLVRSIYKAVKQVSETILATDSQAFRKVLMIEYPRRDMWSLAFKTGEATEEINKRTGELMVTVFVPTTPNPTSGYLVLLPKRDVVELELSVDEALKLIISLGVVQPNATAQPMTAAPVVSVNE